VCCRRRRANHGFARLGLLNPRQREAWEKRKGNFVGKDRSPEEKGWNLLLCKAAPFGPGNSPNASEANQADAMYILLREYIRAGKRGCYEIVKELEKISREEPSRKDAQPKHWKEVHRSRKKFRGERLRPGCGFQAKEKQRFLTLSSVRTVIGLY